MPNSDLVIYNYHFNDSNLHFSVSNSSIIVIMEDYPLYFCTISLLLFVFIISDLFANRLKLKKADVLESKTVGRESVKYLKGNVEFQKGLVDLKCQYGTYKEKKDIVYLFDEVHLTKETLTLKCDSITLRIFYQNIKFRKHLITRTLEPHFLSANISNIEVALYKNRK